MIDIKQFLQLQESVTNIDFIQTARVPVIRFIDKETKIPIDLILGSENALKGLRLIKKSLETYPELEGLAFKLYDKGKVVEIKPKEINDNSLEEECEECLIPQISNDSENEEPKRIFEIYDNFEAE
jgi:hypothetical protein